MPVTAVDELHAGCVGQQLDRLALRHRAREAQVGRHGVSDVHRHSHAGHGREQLVGVEDLPALVEHLPLLRRVPQLAEGARLRDHVAGDGPVPDLAGCDRTVDGAGAAEDVGAAVTLGPLRVELVQTDLARPRHRLVRRYDQPVDARRGVQRCERSDGDHRRAVRARRDALRHPLQVTGIDLGHDERHVRIHAERGRVVDHLRARGRRHRRPLGGDGIVDVDDDEFQPVEAVRAQGLARHLATRERELAALRAR